MPPTHDVYRFRVAPDERAYHRPEEAGSFTITAAGTATLRELMEAVEEAPLPFDPPEGVAVQDRRNRRQTLDDESIIDSLGLRIGQELVMLGHATWVLTVEALESRSSPVQKHVSIDLKGLDVGTMEELIAEEQEEAFGDE